MNDKAGKKSSMFQSYGRITIFLHDVLMIPLAWYLAYWSRFNLDTIPEEFVRTATLVFTGSYYLSIDELYRFRTVSRYLALCIPA